MKQENFNNYSYINDHVKIQLFIEQSENCELIIGKIILYPLHEIVPLKITIELNGIYRIWNVPKQHDHNSTESHIEVTETLSQFDNVATRRLDKMNMLKNQKFDLEVQECFLQGLQKLAQTGDKILTPTNKPFSYPFIFNIPQNTPPSFDAIWFAGKKIQIKYYLNIKGYEGDSAMPLLITQFEVKIRESTMKEKSQVKLCKTLEYRIFTPFCCRFLGNYHIELSANLLHAGQLQIEGRIFREGSKTSSLISEIEIVLMGELKKVKKLVIASKKMVMKKNEYQMLEGQVLLSYDSELRTFESQLITIRFWIQCRIQFANKIWKFLKHESASDILL